MEVTKKQEEAILATRDLEKRRMGVVTKISEKIEDDPSNLTLSKITEKLAQPQAEKLESMRKKLTDLHKRINKVKSRNEFLIKKSMEYIEGTVRLLASGGMDIPTYGDNSSDQQQPKSIMVNRTV